MNIPIKSSFRANWVSVRQRPSGQRDGERTLWVYGHDWKVSTWRGDGQIQAETAWVLGYVTGNCTHCHNGEPDLANSSFDLRPDVFLANTVGRETESSASGLGVRIVPGDPDASVLYLAFTHQDNGTDIKAMPPLGIQLRDVAAGERMRDWISSLQP